MGAEDAPYDGEPTGDASLQVAYARLRAGSGGGHLPAQLRYVDLEVLEGAAEAVVEVYDFHEGAVAEDFLRPSGGWFLATCAGGGGGGVVDAAHDVFV